jgi:hypothetical protein
LNVAASHSPEQRQSVETKKQCHNIFLFPLAGVGTNSGRASVHFLHDAGASRIVSHAGALIVIHKSKIVKSRVGFVSLYPPFFAVLQKKDLNQILKYLCITMSAGAWEPEKQMNSACKGEPVCSPFKLMNLQNTMPVRANLCVRPLESGNEKT